MQIYYPVQFPGPSGSVVTRYEVIWREADSGATEMTSGNLTSKSYTIEQLKSMTNYTITVTATNVAGSTESMPISISTGKWSFCKEHSKSTWKCNHSYTMNVYISMLIWSAIVTNHPGMAGTVPDVWASSWWCPG